MPKKHESRDEVRLKTARLILVPLEAAHAKSLFEPLGNEELYTFIPQNPPATIAILKQRYEKLSLRTSPNGEEGWLNWVMELQTTGVPVGVLEATVYPDQTARIAYTVFRSYWKQGFAREGCACMLNHLTEVYGVHKVIAEIDTRNISSICLVEALGFTLRETIKAADYFKSGSSDEHHYERLLG